MAKFGDIIGDRSDGTAVMVIAEPPFAQETQEETSTEPDGPYSYIGFTLAHPSASQTYYPLFKTCTLSPESTGSRVEPTIP